jgi:hypothetical protein
MRLLVLEPRDVHVLRTNDVLGALFLAARLAPGAPFRALP